MKRRFSFILTCWWIILLLILGVFLFIYAPRGTRISEKENRTLAGAPEATFDSFMDGSYMSGFEDWMSDSFFARDSVIAVSKGLLAKISYGEKTDDIEDRLKKELIDEEPAPAAEINETVSEPAEEPEDEPETAPVQNEFADEPDEESGAEVSELPDGKVAFYLKKTNGNLEYLYTYTEDNIKVTSDMLNAYRDALGPDGTVHYMQIPFSGNAYRWTGSRKTYCGWGSNVEDYLREKVNDGIFIHNIPEMLEEPMDHGEYLYFRLDHHWTPRAANLVVSNIMASQGYPAVGYDQYEYKVYRNFYGSLYEPDDEARMKKMVDRLEIMHPLLPHTHYLVTKLTKLKETQMQAYDRNSYTAYMHGTQGPWRLIDTGFSTGRTALVICDSFGTSFTPYLMPYYDKIVVTDLRPDYYDAKQAGGTVREYIEQYEVDDIYMVLSTVSGPSKQYSLTYLMKYLG